MSCPACRKDGRRVAVWVPIDRPRTARQLAALTTAAGDEDQDHDEARALAARWESEPEWDGHAGRLRPGRPEDACPACGVGTVQWEPGRTLTYCQPCKDEGRPVIALPAAVAAHYDRQAQRRAEVAVRDRPDRSAERATRARVRALKERARDRVGNWLDTIADEDSYDLIQWQGQARELASMLRGYLPEIADAADETELAEVWGEIDALITGEQGKALRAAYDEAQQRAERQYEAQQRAAEVAQRQREIAEREAQQERERIAAEREAARRAREIEQAQRKAITSGTARSRTPAANPPPAMAQLAVMIEQNRQRKAQEIAERGECSFKHWGQVAASRLFGVPVRDPYGRMNGYAVANTPQYRACAKHYEAAEAQLKREGYSDVCYWDLPLQQQSAGGYGYGY